MTAAEASKQPAQTASSFASPGAAPPSTLPAPASGLPPPPGLPSKPIDSANLQAPPNDTEEVASPQGVKRPREEESDDEAPMDEDDDDDEGGEMEMSDDDD